MSTGPRSEARWTDVGTNRVTYHDGPLPFNISAVHKVIHRNRDKATWLVNVTPILDGIPGLTSNNIPILIVRLVTMSAHKPLACVYINRIFYQLKEYGIRWMAEVTYDTLVVDKELFRQPWPMSQNEVRSQQNMTPLEDLPMDQDDKAHHRDL